MEPHIVEIDGDFYNLSFLVKTKTGLESHTDRYGREEHVSTITMYFTNGEKVTVRDKVRIQLIHILRGDYARESDTRFH